MSSPKFVQSKLVNYTNASDATTIVDNNRYKYQLLFGKDIGWDWLYGQVQKVSRKCDIELEVWKIRPDVRRPHTPRFIVDVREVGRRPGIDDNQNSLSDFERDQNV